LQDLTYQNFTEQHDTAKLARGVRGKHNTPPRGSRLLAEEIHRDAGYVGSAAGGMLNNQSIDLDEFAGPSRAQSSPFATPRSFGSPATFPDQVVTYYVTRLLLIYLHLYVQPEHLKIICHVIRDNYLSRLNAQIRPELRG
jgi:hypothetical protein